MPIVAIAPPSIAVRLNPRESIIIPARGEIRKVIPIDIDPTKAKCKIIIYKGFYLYVHLIISLQALVAAPSIPCCSSWLFK